MNNLVKEQMTGLNKKTLTICQKLIPVGKTRENIDQFNAMEEDEFIKANREKVNVLIKKAAFEKIDNDLGSISKNIDFSDMFNLMGKYLECEGEGIEEISDKLFAERINLSTKLTSVFDFKFEGKDTIKVLLPEYLEKHDMDNKEELMELVEKVKSRQSMFNRYEGHIDSMLENVHKKGKFVYRILYENAIIFYNNIKKIKAFDYESVILNLEDKKNIKNNFLTKGFDFYNGFIRQSQINVYNYCVGAINYELNNYCQKNKLNYDKLELKKLNKMPLAETESFFEKIPTFDKDSDVIDAYNSVVCNINKEKITLDDKKAKSDEIIIKGSSIAKYSYNVYGNWKIVRDCLQLHCSDMVTAAKLKKSEKTLYDEYVNEGISVNLIHNIVTEYAPDLNISCTEVPLTQKIDTLMSGSFGECDYPKVSLKMNDCKEANYIRVTLDRILEARRLLCIYNTESVEFDMEFAELIESYLDILSPAILLYNMCRNYISSKPSPSKKTSLTFNCAAFAQGWSQSVEYSKRVSLFKDEKENKYLAIYNALGCKASNMSVTGLVSEIYDNMTTEKQDDCYMKLVQNKTGNVSQALPRLFLNPTLSDEDRARFKAKEYNNDKEFLNHIINVVKTKIAEHETWKKYNFSFKDNYESYAEFVNDIQEQGYKTEWRYIKKSIIDDYVDGGMIYFFRIYNQDYSEFKSSDKLDIQTRYLNYLFSEENCDTDIVKLLANAEVFYREPQITNPYVHKQGSILVNKHYKDGKTIGVEYESIVKNIGDYNNVFTKVAKHDIIKDKRYTVEQFELHMPLCIDNIRKETKKYDELSRKYIKESKNIITITKSRNHLLYVCVFDEKRNLLEQRSLDIANNVNYKEKIEIKEELKKINMESWKSVGSNQTIIEGYISCAIKDITDLVLKYDAVVVMEEESANADINLLKNRNYKKFKTALINKLCYLVDNTKEDFEDGGTFKPYNLCNIEKEKDYKKIWNGIVIQVPAYYLSNKDVDSNFIELADTFANTNIQKKNVVKKFSDLRFNRNTKLFELKFESAKFKEDFKEVFICDSSGNRIVQNKKGVNEVNLTGTIKSELKKIGLEYATGENIFDYVDLKNKNHVTTLHKIIRLILQMYNVGANNSYFYSPVSHSLIRTDKDIYEVITCINLYERAMRVKKKISKDGKVKFKNLADIVIG